MVKKSLKDILFKGFGGEVYPSKLISVNLNSLGPTPISLLRSRRKSLAIHIKEGVVEARAPLRLTEDQIISFLIKKSGWIEKKLKSQKNLPSFQPKTFKTGEAFVILASEYNLIVEEGGQKGIEVKDTQIYLNLGNKKPLREPEIRAGRQLKAWILAYAEKHLRNRVEVYSALVGEDITSVQVRNFKSQWGSCSINADLKFNWRLIMAPPEVLDYVVVHEIAHIKHHNHSPAYWAHVEAIMPDYKKHKKWLKDFGRTLRWD